LTQKSKLPTRRSRTSTSFALRNGTRVLVGICSAFGPPRTSSSATAWKLPCDSVTGRLLVSSAVRPSSSDMDQTTLVMLMPRNSSVAQEVWFLLITLKCPES
jgi:hypothetical protein